MKMFRKYRQPTVYLAIATMVMTTPLLAQDSEMDDLDLGELFDLNMEVTVASKSAEKLSDAPGMIVAWSNKDIKNLGYYTIADLADQTVGYSSYTNFGERILESRGTKADSWNNNKHLLLVDGIPVSNARAGKVPTEEEMPLIGVQRVEFLKGPGSALYGTGAFNGVINVVPKTLKENGVWTEARIAVGSDDFSKTAMASTAIKKDHYTFNATASFFDKEAGRSKLLSPSLDTTVQFDGTREKGRFDGRVNQDSRNSKFLNFSYKLTDTNLKGLGLGFIYTSKFGDGGDFWSSITSTVNEVRWESVIPYIRYQRDFTENLSFNSYVKANHSTAFGAYIAPWADNRYFEYTVRVNNIEALAEVMLDINEGKGGAVTAGANYVASKSLGPTNWNGYEAVSQLLDTSTMTMSYDEYAFAPSLLYNTISFYGQYQKEFPILSGMKLSAGFREDIGVSGEGASNVDPDGNAYDRKGNKYSQFSPRAGVVQKFTDHLNMKVLYGTALRAPGIKEGSQNSEVQATIDKGVANGTMSNYTVKDVGPEVIQTIESSVNLSLQKVSASVAGYYNITTNPLDGRDIGKMTGDATLLGQNVLVNTKGEVKGGGVEVDFAMMPIPSLKIMAGMSYSKMVNYYTDTTYNDTTLAVENVTDYELLQDGIPSGKITGAIAYNHPGKFKFFVTPAFRTHLGYRMAGDVESDKKTEGYTTFDCNVGLPVNEHFSFEVMGRNIFDVEQYQPNGIPNNGRSVKVSLVGNF